MNNKNSDFSRPLTCTYANEELHIETIVINIPVYLFESDSTKICHKLSVR